VRPVLPPRRSWTSWRHGLAAAAVMVLAFGGLLGLSGSEIRYERGAWSLRLGPPSRDGELARLLDEERARNRREIDALKAAVAAAPRTAAAAFTPAGGPARPVELARLLDEERARSRREIDDAVARACAQQFVLFDERLRQVAESHERQRRIDMANVTAGFEYLHGKSYEQLTHMAQTTGTIVGTAVVRASYQPNQR